MHFFEKHEDFLDTYMKWQKASKKNGVKLKNLMKYTGPLNQNKQQKMNVLDELKVLPPMGVFPGGKNFHKGKNHWNHSDGSRK